MKKLIVFLTSLSLLMTTFMVPVQASEGPFIIENGIQVDFTEEEYVDSLRSQGFTVERIFKAETRSAARVSHYKVSTPLRVKGPRVNDITIPGNHYIFTDFETTLGWNYFVSVYNSGIELSPSGYSFAKSGDGWNYTYGGQGIHWYDTGQFEYSTSSSISLSAGWFSAGYSDNYIYRTEALMIEDWFNFRIPG